MLKKIIFPGAAKIINQVAGRIFDDIISIMIARGFFSGGSVQMKTGKVCD
jgi:hypothetical protein